MKLLSVSVSPYRGAPARALSFVTEKGDASLLVALTGPAGVGKTSLLELMAQHKEHVAPYGRPISARQVLGSASGPARADAATLEVSTDWQLEPHEREATGSTAERLTARSWLAPEKSRATADPALVHVLARYAHGRPYGKIDYVPVARVGARRMGAPGDPLLWQRQHRLGLGAEKYGGLLRLARDARPEAREELAALLTSLRPGVTLRDGDDGLGFDTPAGPRAIDELSLSQRLAFDLAATFTLVGLHHSVVLFDTPELGLPAGDALRTLYALRDYAPTTQIVVATTDPGILGAHDVRVLRLEAA